MGRNRLARDWVPCQEYGLPQSLNAPGDAFNLVLVAPRDVSVDTIGAAAPTEVGVVETETEVATTRVIGQFDVSNADAEVLLGFRIRTGIYDNAGGFAFFANSFVDSVDANEPFLWQRFMVLQAAQRTMRIGNHPWWSMLDLKVGRRLKQDTALFFSAEYIAGSGVCRVTPYLRTLARLA